MIVMKKAKAITFATRLKQLLNEATDGETTGMSASWLAQKSGLPRQYIGRYLSGDDLPTLSSASRMARALNVSLAVFDTVTFPPPKTKGQPHA